MYQSKIVLPDFGHIGRVRILITDHTDGLEASGLFCTDQHKAQRMSTSRAGGHVAVPKFWRKAQSGHESLKQQGPTQPMIFFSLPI